jgi:hypothetical protein
MFLPPPRPKAVSKEVRAARQDAYRRRKATRGKQEAQGQVETMAAVEVNPSQDRSKAGRAWQIGIELEELRIEQRRARTTERLRSKQLRRLMAEQQKLVRAANTIQAAIRGCRARWFRRKTGSLWRRCAVVARFRAFVTGWCNVCKRTVRKGERICRDDITRCRDVHVECYRRSFDAEPEETIACVIAEPAPAAAVERAQEEKRAAEEAVAKEKALDLAKEEKRAAEEAAAALEAAAQEKKRAAEEAAVAVERAEEEKRAEADRTRADRRAAERVIQEGGARGDYVRMQRNGKVGASDPNRPITNMAWKTLLARWPEYQLWQYHDQGRWQLGVKRKDGSTDSGAGFPVIVGGRWH